MMCSFRKLPNHLSALVELDQPLVVEIEDDIAIGVKEDPMDITVPIMGLFIDVRCRRPDLVERDPPLVKRSAIEIDQIDAVLAVKEPGDQRHAGAGLLWHEGADAIALEA